MKEILELQYLSYQSQALIYGNHIQPLKQTLQELEEGFTTQFILKAVSDEVIIGSVRAYVVNLTCKIGKLMVHPSYQNKGIGTKLMNVIERLFSESQKFEIFTGEKSERNVNLYNKLGYRRFKLEELSAGLKIVYMEKINFSGNNFN